MALLRYAKGPQISSILVKLGYALIQRLKRSEINFTTALFQISATTVRSLIQLRTCGAHARARKLISLFDDIDGFSWLLRVLQDYVIVCLCAPKVTLRLRVTDKNIGLYCVLIKNRLITECLWIKRRNTIYRRHILTFIDLIWWHWLECRKVAFTERWPLTIW